MPPALGYVSGLVFFTTTFSWLSSLASLFETPALLGLPLLLAAYLSLYPALWATLVRFPPQSSPTAALHSLRNVAFALKAAAAWVLLDWLRGWLFTGFGWNTPGVALHQNLVLIQIADLLGLHGISFVLIFCNLALALACRRIALARSVHSIPAVRIELMAVLLIVCGCISYGARKLLLFRPGTLHLQTACLQPNQPQPTLLDPASEPIVFKTLDELMSLTTALAPPPDLILWPEAATHRGIFADQDNHDFLLAQARRTPTPLLIGSVEPQSFSTTGPIRLFNSAILVSNHAQNLQSYQKRHLVPFGEFLPFRAWMPGFIQDLVPGDIAHGQSAHLLSLQLPNRPPIAIGTLVCFEDSLSRETRDLALLGAQLLVNLTNDAWFGSSVASAQHLANARFRAIETRLPLLRCANTGITALIDPLGRIEQKIPPFQTGLSTHSVAFQDTPPLPPFVRLGERWIWICLLATLSLAFSPRTQPPRPLRSSGVSI
jgi:apolipoprotein N-acyltransferase